MICLVRLLFFFACSTFRSGAAASPTPTPLCCCRCCLVLLLLLPGAAAPPAPCCFLCVGKSPHKPPNDFVALGRQPRRAGHRAAAKTRTSGTSRLTHIASHVSLHLYKLPIIPPPSHSLPLLCAISECRLNLNLLRKVKAS